MPRTPLFALLRRSLHLAEQARATGEPVDELVARWRDARQLSRRGFLRDASVLAASTMVGSAVLGGCAPARGGATVRGAPQSIRDDREPVVIVGAGIAGLTCAYRLRQADIPVRVFEAQGRIGGRMFSLRDHFADGQVCELGGELIDTGHTHIRDLASELEITLNDLHTDDPSLADPVWFVDGQRRSDDDVVAAFVPLAVRIRAALATLADDADPTADNPQGAEALDRMSLAEWLDQEQVSGWFRTLLDVAYTTEYGLEIDRQSALNFLLMINPDAPPFEVFGDSDERFHVQGGNDRIVQTLAGRVDDAVELDTVLEAVTVRPDGRYALSLARDGSATTVSATHVVLALPFTTLRSVRMDVPMSPRKRRAINELGYGTNAKLMVGFTERPWRSAHRSNGSVVTDLPFQLVWETSRLQDGRAGILTNFSGGNHGVSLATGTAAEQAARLVNDLERVFPGVLAARTGMTEARFHWPTNPWVRGSYASYLPGQWTTVRGVEQEPVGGLHFAGEHCSLDAQGYMEGGCETGERAAAAVLARVRA